MCKMCVTDVVGIAIRNIGSYSNQITVKIN